MRYSDLDQFVAEHGTEHNLDLPFEEAINFINRKDFNYEKTSNSKRVAQA